MADYQSFDNPSSQADSDPPLDFSLAPLTPPRLTLSRLATGGQFHLALLNPSSKPLEVQLSGFDQTGQCRIDFPTLAGAASQELRLPPGRTVLPILVTPPPRRWVGFSKRVYHLTIVARPRGAGQAARLSRGHIHSPPLLGPTALTVLTLCLLIMAGLWLAYRPAPLSPSPISIEFITVTPPPPAEAQTTPAGEPPAVSEPPPGPTIPYEQIFREVAAQHNLDWQMLALLAYSESRFDPYAVGMHQDMGLMQIIPATWNEWAPQVGVSDPFDPYSNVRVGAAYLAFLRDYFAARGYHDEYWMLVAYNWGPYNLELFLEDNGHWTEVPHISRTYALEILQTNPEASFSWVDLEAALAVKTVSQQ
ncbi:MAG: transglycosylase SLT domain-containing protein [Anaerolineae bacterium]|nr:transglycosylase SLT domain-containing protein [Anaerolineae bacterium]